MTSPTTMVKRLQGLQGTGDLTPWEEQFVASILEQSRNGDDTTRLSERQLARVQQIFDKHFAA